MPTVVLQVGVGVKRRANQSYLTVLRYTYTKVLELDDFFKSASSRGIWRCIIAEEYLCM
jgi:hypothetical protein